MIGALLTDDARVIIYDRHMFIVQATDLDTEVPSSPPALTQR